MSWAFYGLVSFAFLRLDKIMSGLKESVDKLNLTFVQEVERSNNTKLTVEMLRSEIKEIDTRVYKIELTQAANGCLKECK
jgi:hypothetical protein